MPVTFLLEAIALLIVALGAPLWMMARVAHLDDCTLESLERILMRIKARGRALRYAGEDDETVAKRIDRCAWIAKDPVAALKHTMRGERSIWRYRFLAVVPPSFFPPTLQIATLAGACVATAADDSS